MLITASSDRLGVRRVWGTAALPLEFAVLAAVTVPLTIHFARYAANRQVRWLAMLACGVALFALPAGVSRSGVVALAAALLVYMWSFKVRAPRSCRRGGSCCGLGLYCRLSSLSKCIVANDPQFPGGPKHPRRGPPTMPWLETRSELIRYLASASAQLIQRNTASWTMNGFSKLFRAEPSALTAMIVLAAGGILGISAALRTASTPRERDQAYMIGSIFVGLLASSFTMDLFSYQQATFILLISVGLLWSNFKVSLPEARTALPREAICPE